MGSRTLKTPAVGWSPSGRVCPECLFTLNKEERIPYLGKTLSCYGCAGLFQAVPVATPDRQLSARFERTDIEDSSKTYKAGGASFLRDRFSPRGMELWCEKNGLGKLPKTPLGTDWDVFAEKTGRESVFVRAGDGVIVHFVPTPNTLG